ncbi:MULTISPECIES: YpmS family protein [Virgibacillus]|uniref:DUF2140 family protein n=2 Tax=Virgibacillus TaxID=84406 RepID=A0A024Q7E5_9BACI|nr:MULTISPECIES: YpmS family protein [Virgibacillus]EQB38279.1 hypothetical protein M948_06785 [Virgibacillus sp. CM-4]MYL40984.1 DUF2140 family protein [Virgibacillus massiliensis]GGJ53339.1 hypothetical protein GCM10007111_14440 [Virgibacillus kapii]CDQ38217.1 hypothetical protein BN990_00484 [Virgibacillus massiliensis]
MPERSERRKGKWKRWFIALLSFNIFIVIVLLALIFWPVSSADYPEQTNEQTDDSSEFIVRTTKENLNELVNAYIDQVLNDTNHHYRIELGEDVHLIGELPVFSSTVPLSVHLEPFVQENGDIILEQKSISIGLLELPNQKIMEYIDKYLPMPEWVTVNPEDEAIYVAVTDMELKSNFQVAVEHIDLEANNLAFKFRVPYQTLGIE